MKMNAKPFPYIRAEERSPMLMLDTAIALIPPFFMACFYYGMRSLAVGAFTVRTTARGLPYRRVDGTVPNGRDVQASASSFIHHRHGRARRFAPHQGRGRTRHVPLRFV